jgi:hypothetical protein
VSTEKILKVLKSYTTDLPKVTRLVSLDNRTTWINSCRGNVLRQGVMDDKIRTLKEIPVNIYDMALDKKY